ncbi:hypothetical protein KCP78_19045 [Salmonella enterica subsp. enterica]|nr:hypothetical protein KCP78_19045 [Salmonella enterica subsp. enterica]
MEDGGRDGTGGGGRYAMRASLDKRCGCWTDVGGRATGGIEGDVPDEWMWFAGARLGRLKQRLCVVTGVEGGR